MELLFNVYKVSVWEDEKVLEMDGGDGHITKWMDLVWLAVHVKVIKMAVLCYIYFLPQ